jgi:F-type H+-transporting ATPase subunit b
MELSPTTFILEIINFLVLVWILKRLFFAPVKRTIEARQAAIAKTLGDAQKLRSEADQLRAQYEGRMSAWEDEKAKARAALDEALKAEKTRRLEQVEAAVEAARQKLRAQDERRAAEERERLESEAIRQGAAFTSRLLEGLASADLEGKLIELALGRLSGIKLSAAERSGARTVRTAFELGPERQEAIRAALQRAIGDSAGVGFAVERSLLAGTEILLGSTVVRANLRDELAFFAEAGSA